MSSRNLLNTPDTETTPGSGTSVASPPSLRYPPYGGTVQLPATHKEMAELVMEQPDAMSEEEQCAKEVFIV
eukprot:CAMPEP_0197071818 /NCGR_PEP_ID=MMETSP1384-20130603/209068_1 /TAXON_ID=29189 /ORGANISM="Ammonia sp." /LENGTH=70 /DNA_ID=CAMNT_0042510597 /DNA_START=160 /DNA_END=372 /DNA_ORIENTATION=+